MNRTPYQVANMDKLIEGLKSLPDDYSHLHMGSFSRHTDHRKLKDGVPVSEAIHSNPTDEEFECGSSACIIGHGPMFGVTVPKRCFYKVLDNRINWPKYAETVFGINDELPNGVNHSGGTEWDFCFGADWPNDIKQAIERLQMKQSGKVPDNWSFGDVYKNGEQVV